MIKNENMTKRSQTLRTEAIKEENTLWYRFLRHYPVQFRRQCVFGRYIVDLYCAKALLVVEIIRHPLFIYALIHTCLFTIYNSNQKRY